MSNEIFYRVALKRKAVRPLLASGHLHVPSTKYNPRGAGVGSNLLLGSREAFKRLLKYGFRFSGSGALNFPVTVINTTTERTLTVTNTSTIPLEINSIDITAPFSLGFSNPSPLAITVNPGATADIPVRFTPTAVGAFNAVMTLRETSGEILFIVNLSGSGIQSQPAPVISSFDPHVVQWGDTINVSGQYFTTATLVKIGNMTADFSVVSDTEIVIYTDLLARNLTKDYSIEDDNIVPPDPGPESITGYIKITTPFGTVTSTTRVRLVFIYQ